LIIFTSEYHSKSYLIAERFLKEPAKSKVSKSIREFEKRFAGLLCTTNRELKHAGVTGSDVRIFLNQMSVGQKENIPLYEQRMAEIISKFTIEEIILFCSRIELWDFLNFQLLQDVADHFEVEKLQNPIRDYSVAINEFKRDTKLIDFLRVWAGRNALNTLPDSEPVFAKIDSLKWEDCTLADVARHEEYLAGEFRLKQLVLRFRNAGDGCVVLMWLVTKSVASEMKRKLCSDEKPSFASMTCAFRELNIGGRTFKVLHCLYSCFPLISYVCLNDCCRSQIMTAFTSTALANQKSSGLTEQKNTFTGSSHLTQ